MKKFINHYYSCDTYDNLSKEWVNNTHCFLSEYWGDSIAAITDEAYKYLVRFCHQINNDPMYSNKFKNLTAIDVEVVI